MHQGGGTTIIGGHHDKRSPRVPPLPAAGSVVWLEQALVEDPGEPCPPLARSITADICVVGGGFTGLWSAIEVSERHPDVRVVLIEATACGFGASGRNGGWASGWHDELDHMIDLFGVEPALWLVDEAAAAIRRIGETCDEWGIRGFRQHGALWAAAAPAQLGAWDAALEACRRHGRQDKLELLAGDDVRRRTASPVLLGAARQTDAAAVHPGLLVRGLRRVALARGVGIYEATPALGIDDGRPAVVRTPAGRVEAGAVIVALGAWSGFLRRLRRAFVVVGSHIVATEPLGGAGVGPAFADGELLCDAQRSVHYAQVSPDGRLVFGRGFGTIGWSSAPGPSHFADPGAVARVAADLRRWFPALASRELTHAWGGPVDRTPTHLPFVGTLGPAGNIHYGCGFSGNGVAPCAVVGKVLAAVATGADEPAAHCALTGGPRAWLPPEPFRTAGGAVVRRAVVAADDAEACGRRAPPAGRALRRLATFSLPAPFGQFRYGARQRR